jgi:hypothetical protein
LSSRDKWSDEDTDSHQSGSWPRHRSLFYLIS